MTVGFRYLVVRASFCVGDVLMLPRMKSSAPGDANVANGADLHAYSVMVSSLLGSIFSILSSTMKFFYNATFTLWVEEISMLRLCKLKQEQRSDRDRDCEWLRRRRKSQEQHQQQKQ